MPLTVPCMVYVIDVLAKMPLQASIFASLYNNRRKSSFVSLCGDAAHRALHGLRYCRLNPFLV
jgi:hypothetical protein